MIVSGVSRCVHHHRNKRQPTQTCRPFSSFCDNATAVFRS